MHEYSVAEALVRLVRSRVPPSRAASNVVIDLGALTGILPESLTFYYDGLVLGTHLEGSRLVCQRVPASIHCDACSQSYEPEGFARVCTRCGALGGKVLRGDELDLVRIELRSEAHV